MKEKMIVYLQNELEDVLKEKEALSKDASENEKRLVRKKFDVLIGNKELVEAMIGEPVNLSKDGKVTVGTNDSTAKIFYYGMRLRGASTGAQPEEGYLERKDTYTDKYYDIIAYDRPLSTEEVKKYSLDFLSAE